MCMYVCIYSYLYMYVSKQKKKNNRLAAVDKIEQKSCTNKRQVDLSLANIHIYVYV